MFVPLREHIQTPLAESCADAVRLGPDKLVVAFQSQPLLTLSDGGTSEIPRIGNKSAAKVPLKYYSHSHVHSLDNLAFELSQGHIRSGLH